MATAFSWTCPYCNRNATITVNNTSNEAHRFNAFNKDGDLGLVKMVVVCPHPQCREYTIEAGLHKSTYKGSSWRVSQLPIYELALEAGISVEAISCVHPQSDP